MCNNRWIIKEARDLYRHGCKLCGFARTHNSTRYTHDEFVKNIYDTNSNFINIEFVSLYINTITPIKCHCKVCNYEWNILPKSAKSSKGCPRCNKPFLKKGINDVATLYPNKIKYFVNKEDAFTHTPFSGDIISTVCPECGYVREMTVINLVSQKQVGCPICGDGISYPNKFAHNFLKQLPIQNLKYEYCTEWSKKRLYDNYFEFDGNKYIIEMDGRFHYVDNKLAHHSLAESQRIDKLKDDLAKEHNIQVIRIDSRVSELDYIKTNILNSKLNSIFDLSNINWNLCDEMAQRSLVKQVCDYYNGHKSESNTDIGRIFGISQTTVSHYLNIGTKLNWCNYVYNPKLLGRKFSPYYIYVYDNDHNFISKYESLRQCAKQMSMLHNTIFTYFTISKHCENGTLYKNFYFEKKYKKSTIQEVGDE